MKDCTTCKYGYEDERLGIPMCHHPKRFSEDCVDFNMHEEKETEESEKPINPEDAMKLLEEKIALVKQRGTWDGVDVDKFMDEVRGREPVCEELEKELDEFLKDHVFGKLINRNAGLALARHFAEWQSKQDKETIELAEDHAMLAGMMKMKEQMMKEAVEGVLVDNVDGTQEICLHGNRYGDKVRIIIVKED